MRFRSKPVEIEAVQFNAEGDHPAVKRRQLEPVTGGPFEVLGAQGWSGVNLGDWIITEPKGDGFYPCRPDVFALKYEPA